MPSSGWLRQPELNAPGRSKRYVVLREGYWGMHVEILHIDECPNWVEAGTRVEAALTELGRSDVEVTYRLLTDSAQAAAVPFAGSPTILLDGVDAFPSDGRTSDLACRVYRSGTGFAGVPTVAQLVEAIQNHG